MIKIICLKTIINHSTGEIHFIKNNIYEAEKSLEEVGIGKFAVYYTIIKPKEKWRYSYDDFHKKFIPLKDQRKLKIEKLNLL